jgi:hypothetical protein
LSASSHAFSDQAAFILGYCSTDLQQQLVMRIVRHGLIGEDDLTPTTFKLFYKEHLVNIVASQAIRGRHEHPIKGRIAHVITQAIQSRSP